jgi:Ni/Fe-hydrogenase subunit HybB-like protein
MIASVRQRLTPKVTVALAMVGLLWSATAWFVFRRFFEGLGSVTALTDVAPWGLWISFDVVCGVALAAGGFTMAAAVYVFKLEHYRPILRPAVLTAFLGYILVVLGLIVDLGRPWDIWHVMIMWQPESVMFEVAWCVILYLTVLALEFSPVVFEKFKLDRPLRMITAITLPLVIAGVILSTLHQSSLGSLFLIVPSKLSELWYTPMLPVMFFLSALAVGPAMVIMESNLSCRAFGRGLESDLLQGLGKASSIALFVYLFAKVADLLLRGAWTRLLTPTMSSGFFWVEIVIGVLLPAVLLSQRSIRENANSLFWSAVLVIAGVVLNRFNVSMIGMWAYTGPTYIPSIPEIMVSVSLVLVGVAAFGLAAKFLPVFGEECHHPEHQ